jgi:hypothetical protein
MNKPLRVKLVILFSIAGILVVAGITGSCTGSKNDGNNKTWAKIKLDIFNVSN